METLFMNRENSETNEPHKFRRSSSKLIYYTWKNVRKWYKNNKAKIIAATCNGEFKLLDGSYSVSDIQNYIE